MKRFGPYALAPFLATVVWASDGQFDFMPAGGRTILAGLVEGFEADDRRAILMSDAEAADWIDWAHTKDPDLDEVSAQTLAGYAELNLPLDDVTFSAVSAGDLVTTLPQDGKDLAIAQCQFCHSLFSGYLMHDRDKTGWKSTFKAPFHTEIPMTEVERDTFASYSALNMPLNFEDVPPELRF